jgi:hypothetical protein
MFRPEHTRSQDPPLWAKEQYILSIFTMSEGGVRGSGPVVLFISDRTDRSTPIGDEGIEPRHGLNPTSGATLMEHSDVAGYITCCEVSCD